MSLLTGSFFQKKAALSECGFFLFQHPYSQPTVTPLVTSAVWHLSYRRNSTALLKSYPTAIEAVWVAIGPPALHFFLRKDTSMKHHSFSPGARSLAAFLSTVVLAVLASVALLTPDVAVPSVDSLAQLPDGLDQLLPTNLFE